MAARVWKYLGNFGIVIDDNQIANFETKTTSLISKFDSKFVNFSKFDSKFVNFASKFEVYLEEAPHK